MVNVAAHNNYPYPVQKGLQVYVCLHTCTSTSPSLSRITAQELRRGIQINRFAINTNQLFHI